MEITGPLTIGIAESSAGTGHEIHIDFKPDFRVLDIAHQGEVFKSYLDDLNRAIEARPDDDPNRSGMLLIHQISEQLLPHVENGDLALSDTIVVEVGQTQGVVLTDLLR